MVSIGSFVIGAIIGGVAVWYISRNKNVSLFKQELNKALTPAIGGPKSTAEHTFDPFGTLGSDPQANYPSYSAMTRIF